MSKKKNKKMWSIKGPVNEVQTGKASVVDRELLKNKVIDILKSEIEKNS